MAKDLRDGRVTQAESRGRAPLRSRLFSHGFGFKTVVMVLRLDCPGLADDSPELCALCRGLDSLGGVFDLRLIFTPGSAGERERLAKEFQAGALLVVKGEYSIAPDAPSVTLHNPIYYPVSLHFSEKEIREVFRQNGIGLVKK